jgi:hypothetical protein
VIRPICLVALLGLAGPACPAPRRAAADPRPALREAAGFPADTDLLFLVDLSLARTMLSGRRAAAAAAAGRVVADRLGLDLPVPLLSLVDRLWLGLTFDPGGDRARALVLLCARAPDGGDRLVAELARGPGAPGEAYRGSPCADRGGVDACRVGRRCAVLGPRERVRLAVDLAASLPGTAALGEDAAFAALWASVTGPEAGRPPWLALGFRPPAPLQARIAHRFALPVAPEAVVLRVSGEDWIAVRARIDLAERAGATRFIRRLEAAARGLGPRLTSAGLRPVLEALAVHPEGRRVHLQWQLRAATLEALLPALVEALGRRRR